MNLWFKFKSTVFCTLLNQNAFQAAFLHFKSKQVKVENIQKYNYFKSARYQQIELK